MVESDNGGQGPGPGSRGQGEGKETPPGAIEEDLEMVAKRENGWWVVDMWGMVGGGKTFEAAVDDAVQRMPKA